MAETRVVRGPRWKARRNVAEVFILDWTSEESCHGLILDVSEGGVCFRCGQSLPVGNNVELRIRLGDSLFELLANVRWCSGGDGTWEAGLMFLPGEAGPDSAFCRLLMEEMGDSPWRR